MKTLLLHEFLQNKEDVFHLAKTSVSSNLDLMYHDHDFSEIFWISDGQGNHVINNSEYSLQPGSLWMIRAQDRHTFKIAVQNKSLIITNLAFYTNQLVNFRSRYFKDTCTFFWTSSQIPYHFELNRPQLVAMDALYDANVNKKKNQFNLDLLLLQIFDLLLDQTEVVKSPPWLVFALEKYATPDLFQGGIATFVNLCGRSPDYINRMTQKHFQKSLSEMVNQIRLEFAKNQLTVTNASLKQIAFDSGFHSISYFHRLFRNHYGCTPGEYRVMNNKFLTA